MMKKKPFGKMKTKITSTIDSIVVDVLDEYMNDRDIYNRSELIEKIIKDKIKDDTKTIF